MSAAALKRQKVPAEALRPKGKTQKTYPPSSKSMYFQCAGWIPTWWPAEERPVEMRRSPTPQAHDDVDELLERKVKITCLVKC